jgi:S1-C subfamily serine protease
MQEFFTNIVKTVYHSILLGISTAVAIFHHAPIPNTIIVPLPEYKAPTEVLTFLFNPIKQIQPIETFEIKDKVNSNSQTQVQNQEQVKVIPKVENKKTKPEIKTEIKVKPKPLQNTNVNKPEVVTTNDNVVINILCTETIGNLTRNTTGSGVIISSNGLIVTNAHVAIDLEKPSYNCVIRSGNLARNTYRAKVVYIPNAWIKDNKDYISAGIVQATTGEHDFALLQITSNSNGSKLTAPIPFIKINKDKVAVGDSIETVGYPAERIGLFSANSNLYRINNDSEIKRVYSFGETSTDLFSTGQVSNAEQGSSGGAIIRNSELIGIIANVNNGTINALSMEYIKRYYERDSGVSFLK